tara:strand:+ start:524 stop:883 length:360 start_codon:yes stop_codon:yes gene_type:complete
MCNDPTDQGIKECEATAEASRLGDEDGRAAASWIEDEALPYIFTGILDGDPEVLDALPQPDLSGEWADGRTWYSLANECGIDPEKDVDFSLEVCDTYEDAFHTAVEREVWRRYQYHYAE